MDVQMAEFGHRLRHWRRLAGLTQAQVGLRIGYDHSLVSKLESGLREPSEQLVRRLDDLLQTGGELLAVRTAAKRRRHPDIGGLFSAPLPGDNRTHAEDPPISGLVDWPGLLPDGEVACPLHGTVGCAVPPLSDALLAYRAFRSSEPATPALDPEVIHVLSALLSACTRAAEKRVPAAVAPLVEHTARAIVRWIELPGCPQPQPLLRLGAAYAELAGEMRMLRGQHGTAMAWFHQGLCWAVSANDIGRRISLLCDMSTLARLEGDASSTLSYADAVGAAGAGRRRRRGWSRPTLAEERSRPLPGARPCLARCGRRVPSPARPGARLSGRPRRTRRTGGALAGGCRRTRPRRIRRGRRVAGHRRADGGRTPGPPRDSRRRTGARPAARTAASSTAAVHLAPGRRTRVCGRTGSRAGHRRTGSERGRRHPGQPDQTGTERSAQPADSQVEPPPGSA
ncbi:helix-turn-helix domain-containing protein [Nonomuraea sp. NN258]|nr:helix-turn-helix domain-containing protein [Nonomuraea antri]